MNETLHEGEESERLYGVVDICFSFECWIDGK